MLSELIISDINIFKHANFSPKLPPYSLQTGKKKKKKALRHQIALETLTFTLKRYDYLNSFSFNLVTSFLL
jgi:hypothetical protein